MHEELVQNVVRQVIATLNGGAKALIPAPGPCPSPASTASVKQPSSPAPRKIFVTEAMLISRVTAAGGGAIALAHNEYLTPAAADWAEDKHLKVTRQEKPRAVPLAAAPVADNAPAAACSIPTPAVSSLGLVIDRPDATVEAVVAGISHDDLSLVDCNEAGCWMSDLRAMCSAVAAGRLAAGVAILPYAAEAMVLAGKIRGVRPVQGSRSDSVAAALRRFDANVLIIEHAFSSFHEMRSMIRIFAADRTGVPLSKSLMDAVAELERTQ